MLLNMAAIWDSLARKKFSATGERAFGMEGSEILDCM